MWKRAIYYIIQFHLFSPFLSSGITTEKCSTLGEVNEITAEENECVITGT